MSLTRLLGSLGLGKRPPAASPPPKSGMPPQSLARSAPIPPGKRPALLPAPASDEENAEISFGSVSDGSRTGIYQELQFKILRHCLLRESVEDEMEGLVQHFSETRPPGLVQLCALRRKAGDPPASLYWARLYQKQPVQTDGTQRPRWHKRLEIRSVRDLKNAFFRMGTDQAQREALKYFSRWNALNQAIKILRRLGLYSSSLSRSQVIQEASRLSMPVPPVARIFQREGMAKRGAWLLEPCWKLQGMVERHLKTLDRLGRDLDQLRLPLTLAGELTMRTFAPILWWNPRAGAFHRTLPKESLAGFPLTPSLGEELDRIETERLALNGAIESVVRILHRLSDQLLDAEVSAQEVLSSCPRICP